MKKIELLFVILLAILFQSTPALAGTPKILFCPEKIECTKDKSISSCKAIGKHVEYWGNVYEDSTVKKGVYFLTQAESYYQSPYTYHTNNCFYSNPDYSLITLAVSNPVEFIWGTSSWEAYPHHSTKWFEGRYSIFCHNNSLPMSPEECPFKQVPFIKIIGNAKLDMISAYANGSLIVNKDGSINPRIINMYQAWDACSDNGLCTINLIATIEGATINIGNIIINMDHKMKIMHVDSDATTGFKIYQKDKNTIEINDLN